MADDLIEAIKRDRESGTPGPWTVRDCESYGDRCKTFFQEVWNDSTDILVTTEVTRAHNDGGTVNMRRIARVPTMEARILADADRIAALEAKVAAVREFADDMRSDGAACSENDPAMAKDRMEYADDLTELLDTPTPSDPVRESAGELLEALRAVRKLDNDALSLRAAAENLTQAGKIADAAIARAERTGGE